MRRLLLIALTACGGGGSKPSSMPAQPVVASNACSTAYAEYETRWRVARTEELKEIDFDAESIDEVIAIEVSILPTKSDVTKMRGMYTAVAVFIPDAPWPRALDAADAAIAQCGEESPRPVTASAR